MVGSQKVQQMPCPRQCSGDQCHMERIWAKWMFSYLTSCVRLGKCLPLFGHVPSFIKIRGLDKS